MNKLTTDYFYYSCYDFLKIFKSYDLPFAALHLMSMLSSVIIVLVGVRGNMLGKEDSGKLVINTVGVGSYLLPLIIFYFKCFRNQKYRQIINRYKSETRFSRNTGRIILGGVIIFLIYEMFQ